MGLIVGAAVLYGIPQVAHAQRASALYPGARYAESFDSLPVQADPPGWFDSAPGNPTKEAPGQYKVLVDPTSPTNRTFAKQSAADSYTHLRTTTFDGRAGFRFSGRMLRAGSQAEIGVTFFSAYPTPDRYLRLAFAAGEDDEEDRARLDPEHDDDESGFQLSAHASGLHWAGTTHARQSMAVNRWYRFRIETVPMGTDLRVRARIWPQDSAEPAAWGIDAIASGASAVTSGWIGLWGSRPGAKYWDDLEVAATPEGGGDHEPPTVTITNDGATLADGAVFRTVVRPTIVATDASPPITVVSSLNGSPFVSGATVTAEGDYLLSVTATDALGNARSVTCRFSIDQTPPRFVTVSPPDGSITAAAGVTLLGQVEGAVSLLVDGASVPLSQGQFSAGPFALVEGDRTFLLLAVDAAGNQASRLLRVTRDSLPPLLTLTQPPALVRQSPVVVAGVAEDAHLTAVAVNGTPARLTGTSFALAPVALTEGDNDLLLEATDAAGNHAALHASVRLDSSDPTLSITEGGRELADGALFDRAIALQISASDGAASGPVTVDARLDGSTYSSGTVVTQEGAHLVEVTATDAAGNTAAQQRRFAIDTTAPQFLAVQPAEGTVLGDASVVVTGRATEAVSVTVDGSQAVLQADVFQAGPFALADGPKTFVLIAKDLAGNTTRFELHVTRDAQPPALSLSSPLPDAVVAMTTVVVVGTAIDEHLLEVRVNDTPAVLNGDGFASQPIPLTEGANQLRVEARDTTGHVTRVTRGITLDTTAPSIRVSDAGSELVDNALFARPVVPLIETTDATTVRTTSTLDGAVFLSGTTVRAEGSHELLVTAIDAAGNTASRRITFRIDIAAPTFESLEPADGSVLSSASLEVRGRVRGATEVTVDGRAAVLVGEEFSAGPFSLPEGDHAFVVVAADDAGNHTQVASKVAIDRTAPAVAVTQPADGAVLGTTSASVAGTVADPHVRGVTVNGVKAVVSGTAFLASAVPLSEGSNVLVVRAEDQAGNSTEMRRTVEMDATPPAVSINDPAAGTITATSTIDVHGSAKDAHLERVEVNGLAATLQGEAWSVSVPLKEGSNTILAKAVDRLGHTAQDSIAVERDSSAPAVDITAPADGTRLRQSRVTVSGRTEVGAVVTVNGIAAIVTGDQFTAANVALVEGENRLVARARDAQGNEGTSTRLVVLDTTPPTLEASDPTGGSLRIPADTVFRLTFSEPVRATPTDVRVAAAGQALPATIQISGSVISLRTLAPLPQAVDLVLTASATVADLAGNALVPVELQYHVADATAPDAPTLDTLPSSLCADAVQLSGSTEAGARVAVTGGAAAAEGLAGEDGRFTVQVALRANDSQRLEVRATDRDGNTSPPAAAMLRSDCVAPFVIEAKRDGDVFRVRFSESMAPLATAASIALEAASGPVAGQAVFGAAGDVAEFRASAIPSGALRLSVSEAARDLAGNAMASPFEKVFASASATSFLAGTILDDATGRPLVGAAVRVLSTDGVVLPSPQPGATVAGDGSFQVPVPPGTHDVVVTRSGYTPVFRIVSAAAGAGAHVLDPRLTPRSAPVTLGPLGGRVEGSGGVAIQISAGALERDTPVSLTALTQQAVPALLPYGWSPRAAVWLDAGGGDLAVSSTVSVPVEAPEGTNLVVVALEPATVAWRVLGFTASSAGRATVTLTRTGGLAFLEADAGATAPPNALIGELLGSAARPTGASFASATVRFDPEVVLPSQVSRAAVSYSLAADATAVPSGTPTTVFVEETLTLLDGSKTATAPFHADLVVYRNSVGDPVSSFRLRPSDTASAVPIQVGADDVAIVPYGGESVRGDVLGPDGGEVTDDEGDALRLEAGALSEPSAVRIERLVAAQVPLPVPAGASALAVLSIDIGGHELAIPASLRVVADGEDGAFALLVAVADVGGAPRYRAVAPLKASSGRFETVVSTLPWPGLRRGGRFVLMRLDLSYGAFYGAVRDVDGTALGGALVQIDDAPWVQISASDGDYVLPAPVGAGRIGASDATSGNAVAVEAAIPAVADEVPVDLQLAVVAPVLIASTPSDGAADVPPGFHPTLRFSEPLDPLSAEAGVRLTTDGRDVAIDLDVRGALISVTPRASLQPGAAFELHADGPLRDLQGNGLAVPAVVHFTTKAVLFNKDVDLSKIALVEPDADGQARVEALAGAVPYGTLVFVENTTRLASTVSVQAGRDGSFGMTVDAEVTDRLLLHVLLSGSNELVLTLTPFLTADRHGAHVDERAVRFTTADGITVNVDAGTFDGPATLTLTPTRIDDWRVSALPEEFRPIAGFDITLTGTLARKGMRVSMPAPAGAPAGGQGEYLLAHVAATSSGPAWMVDDQGRLEQGRLTTEPPSQAVARRSLAGRTPLGVDPTSTAPGTVVLPGMYVPGGAVHVAFLHVEHAFGWVSLPLDAGRFEEIVNRSLDSMVAVVDAALTRILGVLERISLPVRLRTATELVLRDPLTGFERSSISLPGPQNAGEIIELGPDKLGDTEPPYPVSGSPLRIEVLDVGSFATGELRDGLRYDATAGGVRVEAEPGSLPAGIRVTLQSLGGDNASTFATTGDDGAVQVSLTSPAHRFLFTAGAHLRSDDAIRLEFSEALAAGFRGISIVDGDDRSVPVQVAAEGTRQTAVVESPTGWRSGVTYRVLLGPELADAAGNAWGKSAEIRFDVPATRAIGSFALSEVHDMARLGSLLLVAAGGQGLALLDASDPAHLQSYLPNGLTLPFPLDAPVRAVAVDPHGRVVVAGAGDTSPGQLKIVDPLAIDRAAIETDPTRRLDAFAGSTIVSNYTGGNIDLPTGSPRRIAVLSDDDRKSWVWGEVSPAGLTLAPATAAAADSELSVSGTGFEGRPVSLRNLSRGRWARTDAAAGGAFTLKVKARAGDRLELLINRNSTAYVAVQGAGVAVVDLDRMYRRSGDGSRGDVLGIYTGSHDSALSICGDTLPDLGSALVDMASLIDPANGHPVVLATLALQRGLVLLESQPSNPAALRVLSAACAPGTETNGRSVLAVAALPRYGFDLDGDGVATAAEIRDYLLVAHATQGLLVYDATDRAAPVLVSQIKLPGAAGRLAVDRERGLAYVSGLSGGLYVVALRGRLSVPLVDSDRDGRDDRLLETLDLGDTRSLLLLPELGIGAAGGNGRLATVQLAPPSVRAVAADGTAVTRLAPLGVPDAVTAAGAPQGLPAAFTLEANLPRSAGGSVLFDVLGVGPGGEAVQEGGDAGALAGLPRASLAGDHGVVLHRLADSVFEDGSALYRSDEIVALADLRAARAYHRAPKEADACRRCDGAGLGVPERAAELLSGDAVAARIPETLATLLGPIYGREVLKAAALEIPSVRWETAPAVAQEAALNAASGTSDEIGVALGSGEFRAVATDLFLKGRGMDFAFTRTYRNQTIGNGPLGPGWDFGFHERLRELPNGDVELYDGEGRRELFARQGSGYRAPAGWFVELERTASGWVLVDALHNVARFDSYGRLVSLADPVKRSAASGNEMRFYYDARSLLTRVLDSLGRSVSLEHDAAGRLVQLRDFAQRTVDYEYDAAGRLVAVTSPKVTTGETIFPGGLITRYEYRPSEGDLAQQLGARDDIANVRDARGVDWLDLTYGPDVDGRPDAVTAERWGNGTVRLDYDFTGHAATVTDRRGNATHYTLDPAGHATRIEDPAHAITTLTYDEEGLVTERKAPLGRTAAYVYDTAGGRRARGNAIRTTLTPDGRGANGSAASLSSAVEYEPTTNQPIRAVDPRGVVTTIERDAAGLAVRTVEAAGTPEASATTVAYNAFGQPIEIANPNGHKETFEYFETGPSRGYLHARVLDPGGLGLTTRFETDERGNVTATIDARGVRSTRELNEVDWVVATTEAASASQDGAPALGYRTRYRHDQNGNVLEELVPYGERGDEWTLSSHLFGTLNERLRSEREVTPGGARVTETTTYDAALNVVESTDGAGDVTRQAYDARNLLSSITSGAGTPAASTQTFAYDLEGNRTSTTDGNGHSSTTAFDGYGRLLESRDALGNRTTMQYDNAGNVVVSRSFDAGGAELSETGSDFDRHGRPSSTRQRLWDADPATAKDVTTRRQYDAAGNVVSTTDGRGQTTSFEYDAAERRRATEDAAGNRSEVQFDSAGNAAVVTQQEVDPGKGRTSVQSTFTYDAAGRRISATDGLGNTARTEYDAQGNAIREVDPEGNLTAHTFDGLGRRTSTTRPLGVSITYGYDEASRLVTYTDALGNTTRYDYDAQSRRTGTRYADGATESTSYDAGGNAVRTTDARGTVVEQSYDAANRLSSRTVHPAAGVGGPTAEAYTLDGLGRVTRAQSGAVVETRTYDSMSRLRSETVDGKTMHYDVDEAGNPTRETYASGLAVERTYDALNRPATVGAAARYTYRGADLIASKSLGNGLEGVLRYDGARRLVESSFHGPAGSPLQESLSWTPRGQKASTTRADLNGAGFVYGYDEASRLVSATRYAGSPSPNNQIPPEPASSEQLTFRYDQAQNLLEQKTARDGVESAVPLPLDGSGRNRPGAIDGRDLAWDANGNLVRKGDTTFHYDYRNRLTSVDRAGTEVASYAYDTSNRRTTRTAGGQTERTVWSGWRPVESYRDDALSSRRTYGVGLDEVVKIERDTNGDGSIDKELVPLYDSGNHLVALTDAQGKPVERYEYTPYGKRRILVDSTPPRVAQLRIWNGVLLLETSEEVSLAKLTAALSSGGLTLTDLERHQTIPLRLTQPVQTGRLARRRILLELATTPPASTPLRLHIEPAALEDTFENVAAAAYEQSFSWTSTDQLIDDTAEPQLVSALALGKGVSLQFSEEVDSQTVGTAITLDGAPTTWTMLSDRYTLASANLADGTHTLSVTTLPLDLSGKGAATTWTKEITIGSGPLANAALYELPDEREIQVSAAGNDTGFQGLDEDPATGLIYMRNRWYDPELGRFITKDPMGYPDGPNGYAFVEGDPVNGRDPSGHYEEDVHDFMTRYLASAAGFDAVTATQIGQETVGLDFDERDAIIDNSPSPRNMRRYHFVSETRLRSMRDWALTSAAPLERIGEYLHALEDTYAHQSNPRHRDFGAQYHDAIVKGGVVLIRDAGHGLELHEPDWTWTRPELAMEMAADVYSELLRLCELRCAQQRYKTFDELRPTLWSFFTYQPTLYVDQFVAAGGFVQKDVPDVLTYRQKIAILDTKFAPERWEEEPRMRRYWAYEDRAQRQALRVVRRFDHIENR